MPAFKEFNFFIGANNSGKSTILSYISRFLPIRIPGDGMPVDVPEPLDINAKASGSPIRVRVGSHLSRVAEAMRQAAVRPSDIDVADLETILGLVADSGGMVWIETSLPYQNPPQLHLTVKNERLAAELSSRQWSMLWSALTGYGQGGLLQHWVPETLNRVAQSIKLDLPPVKLIPAIRQIGPTNEGEMNYSGTGLIDKLMAIQSPDVTHRQDRLIFDRINGFVQSVTGEHDALIEIPHTRAHVLVHIGGRTLPLKNLGTGIHEVVMIAAFCTLSDREIVCIEEPELHLHPLLQRKLINYLRLETNNQYFIATHSPSFIDTPGSAVFHVRLESGQTRISEAVLRKERHAICVDLGHKASDIVQSNAVLWVEGPSDRIYLNHWIRAYNDTLMEGIHYSIMYYGGRLLSHLSADDDEVGEFIALRSLNRNLAIVIDSDRRSSHTPINATKRRIQAEFEAQGSIAWITKGREIENYIDHKTLQVAVARTVGQLYDRPAQGGQFDHGLHFYRKSVKKTRSRQVPSSLLEVSVDKVKVSRAVVQAGAANLDILDLRVRVKSIVAMIQAANQ